MSDAGVELVRIATALESIAASLRLGFGPSEWPPPETESLPFEPPLDPGVYGRAGWAEDEDRLR